MSHTPRRGLPKLVFLVLAASVSSSCARHVRLEIPDTTPASRYTCKASRGCTPATVDDPALLNQSQTAFVILPRQCAGSIHRIVVLNANSTEPEVDVTCSPIVDEGKKPIEEMQ